MEGSDPVADTNEAELERKLSRSEVEQLLRSGLIAREQANAVFQAYRDSVDWGSWLRRWSGAIGAIFLLAGVMFFFAHNWKEMSPLVRFGVLEIAVIASTIAAVVRFGGAVGQWCLAGASVFTGILIAVYGQVYQTGADAFEVFALWSLLMLAWVVISKFAALWVFWLIIVETALLLFGGQVLVPDETAGWSMVFLIMGLVTLGFLILWEWLHPRESFAWLGEPWIRPLVLGAALFWLSVIMWRWIFDFGYRQDTSELANGFGLLTWISAIVCGAWFYTQLRQSVLAMSFCVLSLAVIVACAIGRVVMEENWDDPAGWLMAAILAVGIFGGATALILKLARLGTENLETSTKEST